MQQRRLDAGVLFNLGEVRVYARGGRGYTAALSFPILPLWQVARGEAMPGDEVDRFLAFCERFAYREVDRGAKVDYRLAVSRLLGEGRDLVERVVCEIYDVPDDLADQVVAHAVRRSS